MVPHARHAGQQAAQRCRQRQAGAADRTTSSAELCMIRQLLSADATRWRCPSPPGRHSNPWHRHHRRATTAAMPGVKGCRCSGVERTNQVADFPRAPHIDRVNSQSGSPALNAGASGPLPQPLRQQNFILPLFFASGHRCRRLPLHRHSLTIRNTGLAASGRCSPPATGRRHFCICVDES